MLPAHITWKSQQPTNGIVLYMCIATSACLMGACFSLRNVEAYAAKPIPLATALAGVQSDLRKAGPVVLSDVDGSEERVKTVFTLIGASQCVNKTANPLIPVITGAVQLTLQGQVSESGQFTVSATPGVQATVTRQVQQQLMVPMTFVALSNLADFYLGQQLTSLQYLSLGGDAHKDEVWVMVSRVIKTRDRVFTIAEKQRKAYPPSQAQCDEYIAQAGHGGIAAGMDAFFVALPPP
jgi:hypothetical protein